MHVCTIMILKFSRSHPIANHQQVNSNTEYIFRFAVLVLIVCIDETCSMGSASARAIKRQQLIFQRNGLKEDGIENGFEKRFIQYVWKS